MTCTKNYPLLYLPTAISSSQPVFMENTMLLRYQLFIRLSTLHKKNYILKYIDYNIIIVTVRGNAIDLFFDNYYQHIGEGYVLEPSHCLVI